MLVFPRFTRRHLPALPRLAVQVSSPAQRPWITAKTEQAARIDPCSRKATDFDVWELSLVLRRSLSQLVPALHGGEGGGGVTGQSYLPTRTSGGTSYRSHRSQFRLQPESTGSGRGGFESPEISGLPHLFLRVPCARGAGRTLRQREGLRDLLGSSAVPPQQARGEGHRGSGRAEHELGPCWQEGGGSCSPSAARARFQHLSRNETPPN